MQRRRSAELPSAPPLPLPLRSFFPPLCTVRLSRARYLESLSLDFSISLFFLLPTSAPVSRDARWP